MRTHRTAIPRAVGGPPKPRASPYRTRLCGVTIKAPQSLASAPTISVLADAETVADAAAQQLVSWVQACCKARGHCAIALAGGTTPRPLYRRLASPAFASRIRWKNVHLYFGDERAVPPSEP
ncbi:MAG TPA: 6-phosphogluconolactonase, partial [Sorangium sp.]|nr:6-phosphogluconolactonase [Sorangium sp.]